MNKYINYCLVTVLVFSIDKMKCQLNEFHKIIVLTRSPKITKITIYYKDSNC